jgi:hypothetical protein
MPEPREPRVNLSTSEHAKLAAMMMTMVVAVAAFTGTFWAHVGDSQKHQNISEKQAQIDVAISDSERQWNEKQTALAGSLHELTEAVRLIRDEQVRNTTRVDEMWEGR